MINKWKVRSIISWIEKIHHQSHDQFLVIIIHYSLMSFSKDHFEELNNKRTELIDHMEYLKRLDNREIVIYKKLQEIQRINLMKNYWIRSTIRSTNFLI